MFLASQTHSSLLILLVLLIHDTRVIKIISHSGAHIKLSGRRVISGANCLCFRFCNLLLGFWRFATRNYCLLDWIQAICSLLSLDLILLYLIIYALQVVFVERNYICVALFSVETFWSCSSYVCHLIDLFSHHFASTDAAVSQDVLRTLTLGELALFPGRLTAGTTGCTLSLIFCACFLPWCRGNS